MNRGMLFVKIVVAVVVAVVLQGLIPVYVRSFSYVDLALLVTVYFALMRDPVLGMFVGFAAGLAGDIAPAAGHVAGVGGFSKTLIGFVVASIGVRFPLQGPFTRLLVIGLAKSTRSSGFASPSRSMTSCRSTPR